MKNTVIIYEAPPASEINQMMDEFLEFVNGHSCSDSVMAAIAQYYFVAIHPFHLKSKLILRELVNLI